MKKSTLVFLAAACMVTGICVAESPLAAYFENLPEGMDPGTISRRITDQFLTSRPENYRPAGYHGNEGYGWNRSVQYSVVSLWVNALACARLDGDEARVTKLVKLFDDFLPGQPKNRCCSRPYHVDDTIFGALPYEIYLINKDPRCLEMGNFYADTQWTPPCEGTLKERHAASKEAQEDFWAKGYTPQTRLWIDDMYMITVLQSQAFRATGDRKYIDCAAKEMCLYLDALQLKEGPARGLFYHAPDVKYVWGRGDGWMAAGLALVLDRMSAESEYRARILEGYHAMMETLLKFQRADGLWGQLIDRPDDPRNWGETSCTAMFTYAFATGVARGWLDEGRYGPAARKAWLALCGKLDAFANISDVCVGTGKKDDLQYYFDRPRVNGDPHGQAPMLWISSVLLETGAGKLKGLRTPATSKFFEKRIDPETGVISYALSGGVDENRQSLYFTAKSMTDDGRFLLFDVSPNERRVREARADKKGKNPLAKRLIAKHKALIDFATDTFIDLPDVSGQIPFVDVKDDYMVYYHDRVFYRRDFRNPTVETKLCDYPKELLKDGAQLRYPFTHLTLTRDRKKAFLDSCIVLPNNVTNYIQGLLELTTGQYESWGKTDFFANHGQLNPVRDDLAMCAWESCWTTGGTEYKKRTGWYPRMWHVFPDGKREMHPARDKNYASHEFWDEDGEGFYWCGGGVWHEDLATGKQECLCPIPGAHATMTRNKKYVVFDESVDGWWRGCKWRVGFWNRETKRCVYVYSTRPEFAPKKNESTLHPDPHPQFVCNEKYVVSTANNARGNMDLYVTPMDQLIARTTMAAPTGGKTVRVENPLAVDRPAETISVKWADLDLKPGDTAVRVWDVAACAPIAFQDDRRNEALIFSTAFAAKETKEFRILADESLPQADLSIVCWSQYLPERMDDFAWENDRFGARAYGPIIMEPAPAGQKLVSSGIDIINKCVKVPVLHRWFVERTGEGSYHKNHGEGMDNYKVGPSRGCGGLGARGADGWARSINWSKTKVIQCGPVRTEFDLVYPAWGGLGEETRRVTLDRGQFFAHFVAKFKGKTPEGVQVGPGLDCSKERQHDGKIVRDLVQGWIANWEPDNVDGPDTGNIATAILLAPGMGTATTDTDESGCEYLFPASAAKGVDYWAGATWSGAKAMSNARQWHALVKNFAEGLRNPVRVAVVPAK